MSSNPMDDIPSFDDARSVTDWVINTAAATDINAYTLWIAVRAASDADREIPEKSHIDSEKLLREVNKAREYKRHSESISEPEPDPDPEPDPAFDPEPDPAFDPFQPGSASEFGLGGGSEKSQTPGETDDVVRQQEYDQFKHEVQGLIQNLIEFLISYDMISDDEAEGRDELVSEFEMLTRDFEEDVSEFFDHLDGLLDRAETQKGKTGKEPAVGVDDEMSELMNRLRSSVEELQDIRPDAEDETPQAVGADLEELSEELDDVQYEADDGVSRSLARLNRLLDEVGEYPNRLSSEYQEQPEEPSSRNRERSEDPPQSSSQRREQPQEPQAEWRNAPERGRYGEPEREQGRYEEPEREQGRYDDRYEEEYQEQRAAPQQAAGFTSYEPRSDESRRTSTTETDNTGMFGLLPIDAAWLGAGIAYGGLDMFSTAIVISPPQNGEELNPIFGLLGGSLPGFVLWKTFILFMLFVFFYPDEPAEPNSMEWWVPLIVAAAGVVLTVSNLFGLIGGVPGPLS